LHWQSIDGEHVGGLKGSTEEQTRRMVDRYHDGGFWPLVARREVVREVGNQGVFVLDLRRVSDLPKEWSSAENNNLR
jgi:hypothetical protein